MKDADLKPGIDYCFKTRNSRYDSFAKQKGRYIRRLPPEPGKKRSRTHVLDVNGREIFIDASMIVCTWDEYTKDPEYVAAFQQEIDKVRMTQNVEKMKDWSQLAAVILGLRETPGVGYLGSAPTDGTSLETALLQRVTVRMNGMELKDLMERLSLPIPPLTLLTEESSLDDLIGDIVIK